MNQLEWQKKVIKEEFVNSSLEKEEKVQDPNRSFRFRKAKRFPSSLTNPLYSKNK
ncbi:hypothetical protein [Bacillus sp. RO1]|uniref:hypothetical protein n=1 Tax=Bacillus sp. RO1 TaxID=2722703 RepID=UPI0014563A25|nr:hypothetical protein [Bacillus sp. RO1]NLP52085.1 hypothetical protein [Bacillus sp. RO1]